MEDAEIIALYWQRNEEAIRESDAAYGGYCHTIANNILNDRQDSEECVSDTWLRSWTVIPPQRPRILAAFFAKITRNLALDRLRVRTARKRGGTGTEAVLDELSECLAAPTDTEEEVDRRELERDLSRFIRSLTDRDREIFMLRYFTISSTADIAKRRGIRESNVLLILSRTRKKLKRFLQEEGYTL